MVKSLRSELCSLVCRSLIKQPTLLQKPYILLTERFWDPIEVLGFVKVLRKFPGLVKVLGLLKLQKGSESQKVSRAY